jgi:hypothetical protein
MAGHLADPDFRDRYGSWCEACAHTVEVVARLHAAGAAGPELARQLGLTPAQLEAFIDAERCEYEVMAKLSGHVGVTPPAECPRRP